jgi:hypothetical protein
MTPEEESLFDRLKKENASMRAKLDGEPCNYDFQKEAADMSAFAEKCLREREALELKLAEAEKKEALYDRQEFVVDQFDAWDDLYDEQELPEDMP